MKKYIPIKMIRAGRYKVCFDGLEPEVQTDVLRRMETLITENAEWCDRGNYGHLCNILPTIAIDEALQAHGKTADEAFELISSHMWAALNPMTYQKYISYGSDSHIGSMLYPGDTLDAVFGSGTSAGQATVQLCT